MQNASLESRIASLIHTHFDALPRRSKPSVHENGTREWIPMSGIVLVSDENTPRETLKCVAVATGAKCLSPSQISQCRGLSLHDSHAEILAIRAFNYWLIKECQYLLAWGDGSTSSLVKRRLGDATAAQQKSAEPTGESARPFAVWPPFEIREGVRVYMYCTCAPCGDASMELCMASQNDPTPWELPEYMKELDKDSGSIPTLLDGRAHFSVLGVVRRKPSRGDAESTLSKSCSDKLALRQITSLLSSSAALLVAPTPSAYLTGLILPENEISQVACERSFGGGESGRLRQLADQIWGTHDGQSYQYRPFAVKPLPTEEVEAQWAFGKPKEDNPVLMDVNTKGTATPPGNPKKMRRSRPSNISAVWIAESSSPPAPITTNSKKSSPSTPNQTPTNTSLFSTTTSTGVAETLVNGVKQGYRFTSPSARKASALSRARMWQLLREVAIELKQPSASIAPTRIQKDDENGAESPLAERDSGSNAIKPVPYNTACDFILRSSTYEDLKRGSRRTDWGEGDLRDRAVRGVKDTMGSWTRNRGDEEWGMETFEESKVVAR